MYSVRKKANNIEIPVLWTGNAKIYRCGAGWDEKNGKMPRPSGNTSWDRIILAVTGEGNERVTIMVSFTFPKSTLQATVHVHSISFRERCFQRPCFNFFKYYIVAGIYLPLE
jgi:hypothetical protein